MLFSSPVFLFLFLPLLLAVYFAARPELRNAILLAASLFFYLWGEGLYVAVLLASIAFNYVFGLLLDRFGGRKVERAVLIAAVGGNLALIVAYKYPNFLVDNLNVLLAALGCGTLLLEPVHLPLGISFFTFQALSYVVDVYRRDVTAQRSLVEFALYKTLFPQLIAGPIVRYRDVAAELPARRVEIESFAWGIRRFINGLAKKMLLANPVAVAADGIFGAGTDDLTAGVAWLGIVCYSLQIYFDFSGYSDMAIGLGRMFGFHFPENFDRPYTARSVTEFWRRWHMSLSSWFRDYVYIPLGGNRRGSVRTYVNLATVFLLCGLWHGASWNFIVWGGLHGSLLVAERMGLGRRLERARVALRHAYLLLMIAITWVFFRAATLAGALGYLAAMSGLGHGRGDGVFVGQYLDAQLVLAMIVGVVACLPVGPRLAAIWPAIRGGARIATAGTASPVWATVRPLCGVVVQMVLLVACAARLASGTHNPFIYFRF
jgi:alginate O-acetyltransferase complex protein AlgI